MYNDWRDLHGSVMTEFLSYMYCNTDKFVLKGGTSLMM